jgi:hypothetical protein
MLAGEVSDLKKSPEDRDQHDRHYQVIRGALLLSR